MLSHESWPCPALQVPQSDKGLCFGASPSSSNEERASCWVISTAAGNARDSLRRR